MEGLRRPSPFAGPFGEGASALSAPAPSPNGPGGLRRTPAPLPLPGPFQPPVRVALQPTPEGEPLRYKVTARWEERTGPEVQRTVVAKQLTLSCVSGAPGQLLLTLETAPPALRKPEELLPQETTVLQLAGLYRRLVLQTSPTGRFLELANQAEIAQAWAEIDAELAAAAGGEPDDDATAPLRAAVAAQVQRPERLLHSLQYDYAYGLLVADVYGQRFESGLGYTQPKAFPQFFAGVNLHFHERLQLGPPAALGCVALHLSGRLDEQRTDRAAVAEQVAAALALAPAGAAPRPQPEAAGLAFAYRAACDLDAATGWPLAVAATVSCHGPAGYAKEYDLTIERL